MAKFELNIYGENDEVLKKYETDHIRYGVLMQAVKLKEDTDGKSQLEQFEAANQIVKSVFSGMTDDDLMKADVEDVMNTFRQVSAQAKGIKSSGSEKN